MQKIKPLKCGANDLIQSIPPIYLLYANCFPSHSIHCYKLNILGFTKFFEKAAILLSSLDNLNFWRHPDWV